MSKAKVNTLESIDGTKQADVKALSRVATDGKNICTAWVNFDGTVVDGSNHCTIRDSFNVDYVLRTATGKYEVYFLSAMDNTNYTATGTANDAKRIVNIPRVSMNTNKCEVTVLYDSSVYANDAQVSTHILGGKV